MNFSVRIVNADFYTTAPLAGQDDVFSEFRGSKIAKVPVVRIFGSTPNGQKTCLHVHDVFPYIYLPFKGDEPRDAYLKQFATSIDFALHVSLGKASSSSHHVHNIEIVKARSFYGYHEDEQEFMKICFYNPFIVLRVVELLQNGAVMNTVFQPYESHIPYIQQMFIDYNLYGMNMLNASSVLFRTPIQLKQEDPTVHESSFHSPNTPVLSPSSSTGSPTEMLWNEQTVPRRFRHSLDVERLSVCELEVDVRAENIMNQYEIGTSIGSNPGLVAIWNDERQRRQDEHDDSDISPPISQDRGNFALLEAERKYKERFHQIIEERNILLQSQRLEQEHSPATPSESQAFSSSYDENTPIIDRSIVEDVVRSSQQALSQGLVDANDMEMIEILASLADSQSQSQLATQTAAKEKDHSDDEETQDDQESITMSQQVWDDTDPGDYVITEGDKSRGTDGPDNQGPPLRLSQFNFEGLDETWEVSLLSENPIPQVDGVNDLDSPPPNANAIQRKQVSKRSSHLTRKRITKPSTDKQALQSSSINYGQKSVRSNAKSQRSLEFVSNEKQLTQCSSQSSTCSEESGAGEKRKPTRRLGMSSVKVTSSRNKTNEPSKMSCQSENKPSRNSDAKIKTNETIAGYNSFKNSSDSRSNKRKRSTEETASGTQSCESILKDFDSIFEVEVEPLEVKFQRKKQEYKVSNKNINNSSTKTNGHKSCTVNSPQRYSELDFLSKGSTPLTKHDRLYKELSNANHKTKHTNLSVNSNSKFEEPVEIVKTKAKFTEIKTSGNTIKSSTRVKTTPLPLYDKKNDSPDNAEFSLRLSDSSSSYEESNTSNKSNESSCQNASMGEIIENENVHIKHIGDFEIPHVTVTNVERKSVMESPSPLTDKSAFLLRNYQQAKKATGMEVDELDVSFLQNVQQDKMKSDSIEDMYDNIKRRVFANRTQKIEHKRDVGSSADSAKKSKNFSSKSTSRSSLNTFSKTKMVAKDFVKTSLSKLSSKNEASPCPKGEQKQPKSTNTETKELNLLLSPADKLKPQKFSRNSQRKALTLSRRSKRISHLQNNSKINDIVENVQQSQKPKVPITSQPQSSEESPFSATKVQRGYPELESQDNLNQTKKSLQLSKDQESTELKLVLTDVAYSKTQAHIFAAALDRWKRQNEKQANIQKLYSPPKSAFAIVLKGPSKKRNSPRKSPSGKHYGVLDITVHSSPTKLTSSLQSDVIGSPSVRSRTASSPCKAARSLSFSSSQNENTDTTIPSKSAISPVCKDPASPSKVVRKLRSYSMECSEPQSLGSAEQSETIPATTTNTTQQNSSPARLSFSRPSSLPLTHRSESTQHKSIVSSSKLSKSPSLRSPNTPPKSSFRCSKSIECSSHSRSSKISCSPKLQRSRSSELSPSKLPSPLSQSHSSRSKSIDSSAKKSKSSSCSPSSEPSSPKFKKGRVLLSQPKKLVKTKKNSSVCNSGKAVPVQCKDDINHILDVLRSCLSKKASDSSFDAKDDKDEHVQKITQNDSEELNRDGARGISQYEMGEIKIDDIEKADSINNDQCPHNKSTLIPKVEILQTEDPKIDERIHSIGKVDDVSRTTVLSIDETKAPNQEKKRKRSEPEETSRKHLRLSLKSKRQISSKGHLSGDDQKRKLSHKDRACKIQRDPLSVEFDDLVKISPIEETPTKINTTLYADDSEECVDEIQDSFEESIDGQLSSGSDVLQSKSPSILDETVFDHSTISEMHNNAKENNITIQTSKPLGSLDRQSDCVTEVKDVTQCLTRLSSIETFDSSETLDLDSPVEERQSAMAESYEDSIKSINDEENHDSLFSSSPDLFNSALFHMSYPSPVEGNSEDDDASPPLPFTPSKTIDEVSSKNNEIFDQSRDNEITINESDNFSGKESTKVSRKVNDKSSGKNEGQAVLKEHVKVPHRQKMITEDQHTTASPALFALSADNLSENLSENTEFSANSSELSIGVTQAELSRKSYFTGEKKQPESLYKINRTSNNSTSVNLPQNKLQCTKEQNVTLKIAQERHEVCLSGIGKVRKEDDGDGSSICTGQTVNRTCTTASSEEKHNLVAAEMPQLSWRRNTQNSKESSENINKSSKNVKRLQDVEVLSYSSVASGVFKLEDKKEDVTNVEQMCFRLSTSHRENKDLNPTALSESSGLLPRNEVSGNDKTKENQENTIEVAIPSSDEIVEKLSTADNVCTSKDSLENLTRNGLRPIATLQDQKLPSQKPEKVSALNVLRKYCQILEHDKKALLGLECDSPNSNVIPDNYYFLRSTSVPSIFSSTSQEPDVCSTRASEVSPSCSSGSTDSNNFPSKDELLLSSHDKSSRLFQQDTTRSNDKNEDDFVTCEHDTLLGDTSLSNNNVKRLSSFEEKSNSFKSPIIEFDGISTNSQKDLFPYEKEGQKVQNTTYFEDESNLDGTSSDSIECSQREKSQTEDVTKNSSDAVQKEKEVSSENILLSSEGNIQTSSTAALHPAKEKRYSITDSENINSGSEIAVENSQEYSQSSVYPEDEAYDKNMTPDVFPRNTNEEEKMSLNSSPAVEKERNSGITSSDSFECGQKENSDNVMDVSYRLHLSDDELGLFPSKESSHDSDSSSNESQSQSHGSEVKNTQDTSPGLIFQSERSTSDCEDSSCKKTEPDVIIMPQRVAPTTTMLLKSMRAYGIPQCRYQEPFYGEPNDVPEKTMDVGGRLLKVQTNQVKNLAEFETRSPFVGLKEWRQILTANHETSFLNAFQENIGTKDTFISGIENNNEMKIAFMGDKLLDITPCKPPPHPRSVQLWAEEKLAKKRNALQSKAKTESNSDKLKNDNDGKAQENHEKAKSLQNKTKSKGIVDRSPCVLKTRNDAETKPTLSEKSSHSSDKYCGPTKIAVGSPKVVKVTSPNTLFSPVESTHVFTFADIGKNKQEKSEVHGRKSIVEDVVTTTETVTKQKRPSDLNLPLQSTPIPRNRPEKSRVTSPGLCTPAIRSCLPRIPLLTPITASQGRSAVLSSPSDTEKSRSSQDAPRRQLLLSQLKLCTPEMALRRRVSDVGSEIEGPSPINTAGYKVPQLNIQDAKASHEVQHLTLLSVELHVRTRKDKRPDPEFDPICALFYHAQTDSQCPNNKVTGIICVDKDSARLSDSVDTSKKSYKIEVNASLNSTGSVSHTPKRSLLARSGVTQYHVQYVKEEKDLFPAFLSLIRQWDPDVLIGYELQMLSWGFLIQRALVFDLDLGKLMSRVSGSSSDSNVDADKDQWGAAHTHELKIGGRIILNVWRLMRHEVALNIYTFENIAFHLLRERIPLYTFRTLSDWWDHKTDVHRWRTVEHYVTRCHGNVRLLEQVDFIGRTSELARLFGILFYAVISRGSQFRVESMMLRLSKPLKYVAISPSVQQRNSMNAPEVIPLVLEPESRFYTNPVLVLDFQSLYPSMVIAYNYCYSTCLGRVSCLEDLGEFKFGASTLSVPPALLKKLEDDIHISPNGVAFVKQQVRLGVLPKMLEDILTTRIMVKNSMKKWKSKKSVYRMLDARQLGLKLIANVTYGYTAAHFSGRMPCVEVGDSIVRKARETLEHAIHVVNTTSKWGARVVYGDTDSMFVLLDGASKDEAFRIGRDIADTITAMNPKPVKLKFEKVYLPCVLQTKKRYVGYMYETPDQKEPVFDAKGIETVRRDSCPAVAKVLEKSLRVMFETKDVSLVKKYVQRQFTKVMEGRVSLQDLTFAKEYRGMKSYKPGACVPALELTRQMLKEDRRSEPRVGERVPYVIVYGSPGLPLIKLVRRPMEVLQDPSLRINSLYYITKQLVPPLNRAFSLIGVDVNAWFSDVPRTSRVRVQPFSNSASTRKKTISHYFTTTNCPVCQQTTTTGLCASCIDNPLKAVVTLNDKMRQHERKYRHLSEICYQCCGSRDTKLCCVSLDCPVFHKLAKATRDLEPCNHYRQLMDNIFT